MSKCLVSTSGSACICGQLSYQSFVEINIALSQRVWSTLSSGLKTVECLCGLDA